MNIVDRHIGPRQCEVRGDEFTISRADIEFYEFFDVKSPSVCPEERLRYLASFSSPGLLFTIEKDNPLKGLKAGVSAYPADTIHPLTEELLDHNQGADMRVYGREFDFRKLFVEQLSSLWMNVPRYRTRSFLSSQSIKIHGSRDLRECADVMFSDGARQCYRSEGLISCEACIDCHGLRACSNCCEAVYCSQCHDVSWAFLSSSCTNCSYIYNCHDSSDCYLCTNLTGARYCFQNRQLTAEDYRIAVANFGTQLVRDPTHGVDQLALLIPVSERGREYSPLRGSKNFVLSSEPIGMQVLVGDRRDFFNSSALNNCSRLVDSRNCLDCVGWSFGLRDSAFAVSCGFNAERLFNCVECMFDVSDLAFCSNCESSRNLFGCVGLRNAEFCIFNTQYSRTEYVERVNALKAYMKQKGIWGKFFPPPLSSFTYEDSLAGFLAPLSYVTAHMMGFRVANAVPSLPVADVPARFEDFGQILTQETVDALSDRPVTCEISARKYSCSREELLLRVKLRQAFPSTSPHARHLKRLSWLC